MKITANLLVALAMLCVCVVVLVSCVQLLAFDDQFYRQQHQQMGTAQSMNISESDLDAMMKTLLGYLNGTRPDIDVVVMVDGEQRHAFDERETEHMIDVLALYNGAKVTRNILFIVSMALLGLALFMAHKKYISFPWLMRRCALGLGLGTLFIAGLSLFAYLNFDTFWTSFHELFFSNDLWILNPSFSLMINMLPSQLFFALCMRIVFGYLGVTAAAVILCLALAKFGGWRTRRGGIAADNK